jgi:hypothetical protein
MAIGNSNCFGFSSTPEMSPCTSGASQQYHVPDDPREPRHRQSCDLIRSVLPLACSPGGGLRSRFSWRRWQLRDQPFRGGHGIALSGDGGPGEGEHFGDLWILGSSDHRMAWVWHGTLPHAFTMGAVGFTAFAANAASFVLLWSHRGGDANLRSAWICTRNDVFGNLAVLLAAFGVFGSGTGWPDVLVAAIMAAWRCKGHSS